MTKGSYADKRDANEAAIIAWLRERGCRVVQMPRGAGYDLQVFAPGGVVLPPIEVKNGERAWRYEPAEIELQQWCFWNGHHWLTVETIEQMAELYREFTGVEVTA